MRRVGGAILAVLLLTGVVVAVAVGTNWFGLVNQTVTVRGVIGSEKERLLEDPRAQQIFRDNGYEVLIDTAGSRQIATEALAGDNEKGYDFGFPGSAPVAAKIIAEQDEVGVHDPFFSPMVIASFRPIVDLLTEADIVSQRADGSYAFDMAAYLAMVEQGTRWTDLAGNTDGEVYPSSREILVTSTDVRRSNSGAMYLAIGSYVANDNRVVTTATEEAAVLSAMERIFLSQGFSESSSDGPFNDYLTLGRGKAPLVMAYESQFLDRQIRNDGTITDDMVLMYPSPTTLSQHTLVSLSADGDAVGQLIATDPGLQRLAAEYGFRIPDRNVFSTVLTDKDVAVPPDVVDTVDPPSYEVLERLIVALEASYDNAGAPAAESVPEGDAAGATD